jgi:transcription termination/antitermination protein NusG
VTQAGEAMTEIIEHHHSVSFAAEPLPGQLERRWYAVHTSPRHEKKVELGLREKNVATFLPLVSTVHQWSDRRRLVSVPLFPGYIFVHAAPSRTVRLAILQTHGVLGFVGNMGAGAPLPDQQIETVRNVIDSGV